MYDRFGLSVFPEPEAVCDWSSVLPGDKTRLKWVEYVVPHRTMSVDQFPFIWTTYGKWLCLIRWNSCPDVDPIRDCHFEAKTHEGYKNRQITGVVETAAEKIRETFEIFFGLKF